MKVWKWIFALMLTATLVLGGLWIHLKNSFLEENDRIAQASMNPSSESQIDLSTINFQERQQDYETQELVLRAGVAGSLLITIISGIILKLKANHRSKQKFLP